MSPRPRRGDTWTCTTCGATNDPTRKKCMNGCDNGLQLFNVEGGAWRFGQDPDGRPWAVATDVAKSFDYRDAEKVTRLLDEDEKGTRIVGTPGGQQELAVIFEDGLWELIFISRKPEARAIKKRVKAILRQIRETGHYEAEPRLGDDLLAELEMSNQRTTKAIEIAKSERDRADAAEQRAAELEGPAHSWEVLASGRGDLSVADAAKILSRDPAISIGERRLFTELHDAGWTYRQRRDNRWRAYQEQIDNDRLSELPQEYENPQTGEMTLGAPQVRIKIKGLRELHRQLGGIAALRLGEQLAIGGA